MDDIYFSIGDMEEACNILREAAQWLIDSNRPLWRLEDLTPDTLKKTGFQPVILHKRGGTSIATCLFGLSDPIFWPKIPDGSSGFLHKLAVKREYSNLGYPGRLIYHVVELCKNKGINALSLDCDAERTELCHYYESLGF